MKSDYIIDLSLPPTERWLEVARKEKAIVKRLVDVIKGFVLSVPKPVFNAISAAYWLRNASYLREANAFADVLGERRALLQAAQVMYELTHLVDRTAVKASIRVGCTTSVAQEEGRAVLMRTLDWALPGMQDATRVFTFIGPSGVYKAIGTVGAVSVFTALHEQGFAITLNDAPAVKKLRTGLAPSFQIRRVMEQEDTYHGAVRNLSKVKLATSAFFVVCGAKKATLIEHVGRTAKKREGPSVAITNHYTLQKAPSSLRDTESEGRLAAVLDAMENEQRDAAYRKAPIVQPITMYKSRCVPSEGLLELF